MIWMVTTCSKSKAVRISLIIKGHKVQSHCDFSSDFFFSFHLLPTKISMNDTLGRKSKARYGSQLRIWKWIENIDDSVRFSNDFLMRIGTSQWLFPLHYHQFELIFLTENWLLVLIVWVPPKSTPIDLPELVDWKSG